MRRWRGFGPWWGVTLVILGSALIMLNAATFPWPPGDRGLFDIGPWIALFFVGLGVRLIMLGRRDSARMKPPSTRPEWTGLWTSRPHIS